MKTTKLILILLAVLLAAGCQNISKAINNYYAAANHVQIGDSKETVLAILQPAQTELSLYQRKAPEIYLKDGKRIEIYYFRSAIQSSDIRTDDEFTPYVFEDGKLVAIGWTYLGGPKTQAFPRPEQHINIIR